MMFHIASTYHGALRIFVDVKEKKMIAKIKGMISERILLFLESKAISNFM